MKTENEDEDIIVGATNKVSIYKKRRIRFSLALSFSVNLIAMPGDCYSISIIKKTKREREVEEFAGC